MEAYETLRQIAQGAKGRVYHVRHRLSGKHYALKILSCNGREEVNQSLEEVKALWHLQHPTILRYENFFLDYDDAWWVQAHSRVPSTTSSSLGSARGSSPVQVFQDATGPSLRRRGSSPLNSSDVFYAGGNVGSDGATSSVPASTTTTKASNGDIRVCLVLEYCDGGDVETRVETYRSQFMATGKHPCPEACLRRWLQQCAEALQYIHRKGLIHRDVKPANVFFSSSTTSTSLPTSSSVGSASSPPIRGSRGGSQGRTTFNVQPAKRVSPPSPLSSMERRASGGGEENIDEEEEVIKLGDFGLVSSISSCDVVVHSPAHASALMDSVVASPPRFRPWTPMGNSPARGGGGGCGNDPEANPHVPVPTAGPMTSKSPTGASPVIPFVGTPFYVAPELLAPATPPRTTTTTSTGSLARRNGGSGATTSVSAIKSRYTPAIDMWGLGVVFIELLTLRDDRCFNQCVLENPTEAGDEVAKEIVELGFSTFLAAMIRDLVQRYPEDRPTAEVVLNRLRKDAYPLEGPMMTMQQQLPFIVPPTPRSASSPLLLQSSTSTASQGRTSAPSGSVVSLGLGHPSSTNSTALVNRSDMKACLMPSATSDAVEPAVRPRVPHVPVSSRDSKTSHRVPQDVRRQSVERAGTGAGLQEVSSSRSNCIAMSERCPPMTVVTSAMSLPLPGPSSEPSSRAVIDVTIGDDLQRTIDNCDCGSIIRLQPGTYILDRPLMITRPMMITVKPVTSSSSAPTDMDAPPCVGTVRPSSSSRKTSAQTSPSATTVTFNCLGTFGVIVAVRPPEEPQGADNNRGRCVVLSHLTFVHDSDGTAEGKVNSPSESSESARDDLVSRLLLTGIRPAAIVVCGDVPHRSKVTVPTSAVVSILDRCTITSRTGMGLRMCQLGLAAPLSSIGTVAASSTASQLPIARSSNHNKHHADNQGQQVIEHVTAVIDNSIVVDCGDSGLWVGESCSLELTRSKIIRCHGPSAVMVRAGGKLHASTCHVIDAAKVGVYIQEGAFSEDRRTTEMNLAENSNIVESDSSFKSSNDAEVVSPMSFNVSIVDSSVEHSGTCALVIKGAGVAVVAGTSTTATTAVAGVKLPTSSISTSLSDRKAGARGGSSVVGIRQIYARDNAAPWSNRSTLLRRCHVDGCSQAGVYLSEATHAVLEDLKIEACQQGGIFVKGHGTAPTIRRAWIIEPAVGMRIKAGGTGVQGVDTAESTLTAAAGAATTASASAAPSSSSSSSAWAGIFTFTEATATVQDTTVVLIPAGTAVVHKGNGGNGIALKCSDKATASYYRCAVRLSPPSSSMAPSAMEPVGVRSVPNAQDEDYRLCVTSHGGQVTQRDVVWM